MCCCSWFLSAAVSTDSLALIWWVRYTYSHNIQIDKSPALSVNVSRIWAEHGPQINKRPRQITQVGKTQIKWDESRNSNLFIPVISKQFFQSEITGYFTLNKTFHKWNQCNKYVLKVGSNSKNKKNTILFVSRNNFNSAHKGSQFFPFPFFFFF